MPRRSFLLAALLLASGCGRAIGPERVRTGTVSGRVQIRGVPFSTGWIEFVPIDGTVGRFRSARLRPDGSFEADRVPAGRVGIRHGGPLPPGTRDPQLNHFLASWHMGAAVPRDVREGRNSPMIIDLRDELDELERRRAEAVRPLLSGSTP